MWKRDFPSIYKALNSVTWSEGVANIMKQVEGSYKKVFLSNKFIVLVIYRYSES